MPAILTSLAGKILSGVAVALLGLAIVFWIGWSRAANARDEARENLRTAEAQLTLLRVDFGLRETASVERQNDTAEVANMEKELVDAIKTVPDSAPDLVRVRLGCERLRKAGYLDADLPASCGPVGGTQAGSAS